MSFRLKSRWRNPEGEKSLQDNAFALAYIVWRLALERAINLHGQDFVYEHDGQRVTVIAEYLAYGVQVADRLAYGRMDDVERNEFINAYARRLADHVQDNLADLFGPSDYRAPFIDKLNERLDDYAQFGFDDDAPGYAFRRYLGERIQAVLGQSQTNKWVIEQVMEIDAIEIARTIKKAMSDLLEAA